MGYSELRAAAAVPAAGTAYQHTAAGNFTRSPAAFRGAARAGNFQDAIASGSKNPGTGFKNKAALH